MERIAGGSLALVLLLPGCASGPEPDAPAAGTPTDRSCAFEGMTLHYVEAGAGAHSLVLVHGWGGAASVWHRNLPELAADARVLAVDLPGHGDSDAPDIDYTAGLMARAVAAVMADAGCNRAVLVGHSNGGPLVRVFQRMFPERTAGLVFVDAPLKGFLSIREVEEMAAPLLTPGGDRVAAGMADGVVASAPAGYRVAIRRTVLDTPLHVLHSTLIGGNSPELWTDDPITAPVLALYTRAPFWDSSYEAYVRGLCPDLDYRVWDGVGHFMMLDRPARFHAAVRDFMFAVGKDG